MKKDTKFKPGQSGNPETRFKPGNQHRWPPRQSGNPAGITRSRLQFEESFYAAPLDRGRAGVAFLLWNDPHPGTFQTLLVDGERDRYGLDVLIGSHLVGLPPDPETHWPPRLDTFR